MDEPGVRALLARMASSEPPPPQVDITTAARNQGRRRLRWRRAGLGAVPLAASAVAAIGLIVTGAVPFSLAGGHLGRPADNGRDPTAYVTFGTSDVLPVNLVTREPGKPIRLDMEIQSVVTAPDGRTVYVGASNMEGSDTAVIPISTATDVPGRPIRAGRSPRVTAFTPNGRTMVDGGWNTVWLTSMATGAIEKRINVGFPLSAAVTPDGMTAYVGTDPNSVTPVTLATGTLGKPVKVGQTPMAITITPDGQTVYVISDRSATVTPISTATNTPGRPIKIPRGDSMPIDAVITPDGRTLYVMTGTNVVPISTATNKAGKPIRIGNQPNLDGISAGIAITPDGKWLYATTSSALIPISTATNRPGRPIRIPTRFWQQLGQIAIAP
ncbi:MAG TPA: YncE family protein [Streptosporangiaceae bacterium]|nr:YncE family protein [Streptosporangiaceae bacterium]